MLSHFTNCSWPVDPMSLMAPSVSRMPGSCTRIEFVPCRCTDASDTPRRSTRLRTMSSARFIAASFTGDVRRRLRREDHGQSALQVEALADLRVERHRLPHADRDENQHQHEREHILLLLVHLLPSIHEGTGYSSRLPLITSENVASSTDAALRHICMRDRKISKYSIT